MRPGFQTLSVFAVLLVMAAAVAAEEPVRLRVLLLGQKPDSHPATTHEYMAGARLLGTLLERSKGIQALVASADSPWTDGPELLDQVDGVVVFVSEGAKWLTEEPKRLAAFQRLARRSGGLTCLHWGMGTRDAAPIAEFTALFGGCHGGPDRKYKVATVVANPVAEHPIVSGIAPFEVRDEFYYALKQAAPEQRLKVVPLLRVPIDGADQTVAWACERPDNGRSFGFSGLHFHENWKRVEYRRLVLQGILWTLHREIPEAGIAVDIAPETFELPTR
ncbi:MAG: hypothetical protein E6Q76_11730 [Rhizobium sp.]|nr:MAG: hypothetical protein E6Q76_11730 [Rhizobium sp.]